MCPPSACGRLKVWPQWGHVGFLFCFWTVFFINGLTPPFYQIGSRFEQRANTEFRARAAGEAQDAVPDQLGGVRCGADAGLGGPRRTWRPGLAANERESVAAARQTAHQSVVEARDRLRPRCGAERLWRTESMSCAPLPISLDLSPAPAPSAGPCIQRRLDLPARRNRLGGTRLGAKHGGEAVDYAP